MSAFSGLMFDVILESVEKIEMSRSFFLPLWKFTI